MRWYRYALLGAVLAGVAAALGGYVVFAYDRSKREWEAFWEECS